MSTAASAATRPRGHVRLSRPGDALDPAFHDHDASSTIVKGQVHAPASGQAQNGLGNLAARDIDQLAAIVKNPLERIQGAPARIRAPAPKLAGQGVLSDIIAVARRQPRSSQTAATHSLAENTRPAGQAHKEGPAGH